MLLTRTFYDPACYSSAMYQDNDSIEAFERLHARDRLADLARTHKGEADTDLMTAHMASGWHEGWLLSVLSLVAIAALLAAVVLRFV